MSDMKVSGVSWNAQSQQGQNTPPAAQETQEKTASLTTPKEVEGQTIQEMLREAREKAQERRDSLKLKVNPSQYGDAAMTAYARLARARTAGQVNAAAGYAQRQIARLQAAQRSDSENAPQIRAAIRQLQKVSGRAGKKRRELQREDLIRARAKKAQREENRRKAAAAKQELLRRKTMRMIREGGYLRETEIDNRQQAQLAATRMELQQQMQAISDQYQPSPQLAAQGYAAQSVGGEVCPPSGGGVDLQA